MSVSTTVHSVARITIEGTELKRDGRSRDTWIAHRIRFIDEHGETLYEVSAHGLDNEPMIEVVTTKSP